MSRRERFFRPILVTALVAALPAWFWYTFVRDVRIEQSQSAVIADRFTDQATAPSASPELSARLRELLPYPSTALTYDRTSRTLRMYEQGTGRAFAVHPSTLRVEPLSEARLDGFRDTEWSPNGHEVVSTFLEDGRTVFRYYDYRSGRVAPLPASVTHLAFSPNGSQVVTARDTGVTTELWVSAPDGSSAWLLLSSRLTVTDLSWPNDAFVAVISEREGGVRDLSRITMDGILQRLVSRRPMLEATWSPDARSVLLSTVADGALSASLLSPETGSEEQLPDGISAAKCAWGTASTMFACGVSDYGETARASTASLARRDTVVSFSVATQEPTIRFVPDPEVSLSIAAPVVLPGGSGIAFLNRIDQKPYLVTW